MEKCEKSRTNMEIKDLIVNRFYLIWCFSCNYSLTWCNLTLPIQHLVCAESFTIASAKWNEKRKTKKREGDKEHRNLITIYNWTSIIFIIHKTSGKKSAKCHFWSIHYSRFTPPIFVWNCDLHECVLLNVANEYCIIHGPDQLHTFFQFRFCSLKSIFG